MTTVLNMKKPNTMKFTKMNGLGNDFVVFKGPLNITKQQVQSICNRETGIGSDGLLIISKKGNGVKMDYWNNDGSVAEMCGNGLRCAVRFSVENDMVESDAFTVYTAAGPLECRWDGKDHTKVEIQVGKTVISESTYKHKNHTFHCVDIGNPHAITFVNDVKTAPVKTIGPAVETDPYFPNKTNVEFAQIINKNHIKIRIWERGVGETQACGTGMAAVAAMAQSLAKAEFPLCVEVPGGKATLWKDNNGYIRMQATAENDFEGETDIV